MGRTAFIVNRDSRFGWFDFLYSAKSVFVMYDLAGLIFVIQPKVCALSMIWLI